MSKLLKLATEFEKKLETSNSKLNQFEKKLKKIKDLLRLKCDCGCGEDWMECECDHPPVLREALLWAMFKMFYW